MLKTGSVNYKANIQGRNVKEMKLWRKKEKNMEICIFLGYVIVGCSRVASYSPKLFFLPVIQINCISNPHLQCVSFSQSNVGSSHMYHSQVGQWKKKKKKVPNAVTPFPTAITLKVTWWSDRATSPRSLHSHLKKSYPTRNIHWRLHLSKNIEFLGWDFRA